MQKAKRGTQSHALSEKFIHVRTSLKSLIVALQEKPEGAEEHQGVVK